MTSAIWRLLRKAIQEEKQVVCVCKGRRRELRLHIIGHTGCEGKVLPFQFAGESSTRLPPGGTWRCLHLSQVRDARPRSRPLLALC